MYLLLLVFGGLLGAAGVVLAGSGMSLRDGTFDAAILTPGIVAAAGGLLLIGLGAGLRTLQRIERTLAARPMPRALAIAEGAKVAENVETPREPARIPFATKATHESQPGIAARDIVADKSPTAASGAEKASPPIPAIAIAAVPGRECRNTAVRQKKRQWSDGSAERASPIGEFAAPERRRTRTGPRCAVAERPTAIARCRGCFSSDRPEHRCDADPFATKRRHVQCGGIREQSGECGRWGVGAQVGRRQRHAVYALFGWVDRSTVAGGHAAFRFDYRIAQSHRTKRLKIKMPAGAHAAKRLRPARYERRCESAPPWNGSRSSAAA